jgi:hypothetical protein
MEHQVHLVDEEFTVVGIKLLGLTHSGTMMVNTVSINPASLAKWQN